MKLDVKGTDEWQHVLLPNGKIAFYRVSYDESPPNPCEDTDGMGIMYSFSRKHGNYLKMDYPTSRDECEKILRRDFGKYIQILGYFEHGQCDWHLSGCRPAGTECDYRWDGCSFAGMWVPDEVILAELKKIRGVEAKMAYAVGCAEACCKTYTQWCNGEVYAYSVDIYDVKKTDDDAVYDMESDYRHTEALASDSCCEYYGYDDVIEALQCSFSGMVSELDKKNLAKPAEVATVT